MFGVRMMCGMTTISTSWSIGLHSVLSEVKYFRKGTCEKPGQPLMVFVLLFSIKSAEDVDLAVLQAHVCSILLVPMTGWLIPPMLCVPVTDETSIESFKLTS